MTSDAVMKFVLHLIFNLLNVVKKDKLQRKKRLICDFLK